MRIAGLSAALTGVATLLVLGPAAHAQQHEVELEPADTNIANTASLQRGAKYFVNYCMGCHSAQYVRYNTLADDLQLTEDQLIENLMFTGEQPFDTMDIAMRAADAERWFGVEPPDLSLIARSRGTDYIYTFLKSFYAAPDRATGVDNRVMPNTSMPHVLWRLQGLQRPDYEQEDGHEEFVGFELIEQGQLTEAEYDRVVRDIVNFLDYIGEPMQRDRVALGLRVIGFLLVLLLLAYLLKKEIWKDVT